MSVTRLVLASLSRVEDGAYAAMADVCAAALASGIEYRIIGGHMVNVHVARHQLELPDRGTGDADLGLDARVLADGALVAALTAQGYQLTSGNRLELGGGDGTPSRAIDVLVPAETSRIRHNRPVGTLFVDEAPGLHYALARKPHEVELTVRLTDASTLTLAPCVPDLVAALCLKVLAYLSRAEPRDAIDIWRLLEVAYADGLTAHEWPTTTTPARVAQVLREHFVPAAGPGLAVAALTASQQVRLRALARSLTGPG